MIPNRWRIMLYAFALAVGMLGTCELAMFKAEPWLCPDGECR